ncbi:MAG: right-handed parallel beta-helix repeat-containing protein [Planctomycetes bacterium]|nr:right-handed parallel beta-helix repeat-containing protein [Planctomycetota bacterium]
MSTIATSFLAVLLFAVPQTGAEARTSEVTFFVSPDGNDAWSGRLADPTGSGNDGPFATVGRAQRAIRELHENGALSSPATVRIRGIHQLGQPIVFKPEDSGTAECPVTYTSYAGQRAVLSGGWRIGGWREAEDGVFAADLPEAKAGKWYFRQLFVNGKRAQRARSPNEGYYRVPALVEAKPGARWNEGVDRFRFEPGDIESWKDLKNVEVVVYHSWNTSRVRIASVDTQEHIVTFTGPTVFRPLAWDPDQRYYVENARELLDAPGEWYLDRQTGTLYYRPSAGEDMESAEVIAPVLGELVRFDGDPDAGEFVDHVQLTGLSFQHADWSLPEEGYGDPQAAVTIPAVIAGKGARWCAVENCEVAHVGNYGIWFSRGCKDNRIVANHVWDMGAGGVRIGEPNMAESEVAESSRNLISNNYIHDGGSVYAGAIGFWLAQSSHNVISHNEIHSLNYSGMSIGWNWSEAPNRTHHNRIENNHIHHVVRGVLSDAGGIYTLGTQTGSVIRNNLFHDIFPYMGKPAMAWGIYMDQGSNGHLIENNIVYNTLTGSIMNTGLPENVIRNNVFAFSGFHAAWRYLWTREPSSVCERNIFYLTQGDLFHRDGGADDNRSKWDQNLFWRTDGQPLLFYDDDFDGWQARGLDRNSLVADPLFADPEHFDFRLRPDSPALELGIEPIDMSQNGLIGDPEWVSLPKKATFPLTVLPPAPPLFVAIDDGFEKQDAGDRPDLAIPQEEGGGDAVRVTDRVAASGRKSLEVADAPGLEHIFNPHLYYQPRYRFGRAVLSFDLRLEPGAIFAHEWRDASQPYHVGPSIRIDADGQLQASGKPLAKVPIGEWIHVELTCSLGTGADGKYRLAVTNPDQPPQTFASLPCGSAEFKCLEWLGFVSLASDKTAFYLDNIKLAPPTVD